MIKRSFEPLERDQRGFSQMIDYSDECPLCEVSIFKTPGRKLRLWAARGTIRNHTTMKKENHKIRIYHDDCWRRRLAQNRNDDFSGYCEG